MPQIVIGAVISAGISTAVAAVTVGFATTQAFGIFLAKTAAAYFARSFVTSLVLGAISQALTKKPSGSNLAASSAGQTVTARQAIGSHNIVYGRTRLGGTIVHMESTSSNKYLHFVIAVTGHEIDAFETVYFNDEVVSLDGSGFGYSGKARIKFKYGTDDQTAFSDLVAESSVGWSANHRLRGIACAYVRLEFDQDRFPNGIPNISFLIRGKKVYDPRSATTVWSANPALCLNDYLTNTRYGLGATYADEIDSTALIAAANICDELVALDAGGTEKRYEAHGVISTANTSQDIIPNLLSAMAGKAIFTSGKWRILAGAYAAPVLSFDENDLRGGFRVQSLVSRRENFNCVKGIFSSKVNNYIVTDFPPIISSTFIAQDSGETVYRNIELTLTTSASMAQRLAKIELLKARQQITVTLPLKMQGLQANVGDIIQVNNTRMGWVNKNFEVVSANMALGESLGVDLELREISTDVYDWSTSEEQAFDPAPNTNLPNPFTVAVPGVPSVSETLYQTTGSAGVKTRVNVTFVPQDNFAMSQRLSWRPVGGEWSILPDQTQADFVIDDAAPGFYEFRGATVNVMGVTSAWSAVTTYEVIGLTAPPANVLNFNVISVAGRALGSWDLTVDLDVRIGGRVIIRHSPLSVGATWEEGVILEEFNGDAVNGNLPLLSGTYMVKFKDSTHNYSENASLFVATESLLTGYTTTNTLTESPSFVGNKSNLIAVDNKLKLLGATSIDSLTDPIDNWIDIDAYGGLVSSGQYDFSTYIDFASVVQRKIDANIEVFSYDVSNWVDQWSDLDDLDSIDGGVINDTDAIIYYRATNDDPASSPTWGSWTQFMVADVYCRAIQLKMILVTDTPTHQIEVSALSVRARSSP